jgi:hypothetical protein
MTYPPYKYPYSSWQNVGRKCEFSHQSASKFSSSRVERERGKLLSAGGLPDLSGVLGVAQARKLCKNPFGFDGVFRALVRSSVGALSGFYEF